MSIALHMYRVQSAEAIACNAQTLTCINGPRNEAPPSLTAHETCDQVSAPFCITPHSMPVIGMLSASQQGACLACCGEPECLVTQTPAIAFLETKSLWWQVMPLEF